MCVHFRSFLHVSSVISSLWLPCAFPAQYSLLFSACSHIRESPRGRQRPRQGRSTFRVFPPMGHAGERGHGCLHRRMAPSQPTTYFPIRTRCLPKGKITFSIQVQKFFIMIVQPLAFTPRTRYVLRGYIPASPSAKYLLHTYHTMRLMIIYSPQKNHYSTNSNHVQYISCSNKTRTAFKRRHPTNFEAPSEQARLYDHAHHPNQTLPECLVLC